MASQRAFHDLRATQVRSLIGPRTLLLQPIAAVEQHGPHLPMSTDLVIATSAAEALIADYGDELDLYVLPAIAYGKSDEHHWSPGTISLSTSTLLALINDLGRSLSGLPTKRLVFLNGHGGNTALLQLACRELRIAYALETFLVHPSLPVDAGGAENAVELNMGIHAGLDETSLMLHLRPELVDMESAVACIPEALVGNRFVRFEGPVHFGWTSDDFGQSGVIGDPMTATADLGKLLFAEMIPELAEMLREIRSFRLRDTPA